MRTCLFAAIACAFVITGCADFLVRRRTISGDAVLTQIGQPQSSEQQAELIGRFVEKQVQDPKSNKIRVTTDPLPGWKNGGLGGLFLEAEGWIWNFELNAMNRFGDYVGWKQYQILYNPVTDQLYFNRNPYGIYPYRIKGEVNSRGSYEPLPAGDATIETEEEETVTPEDPSESPASEGPETELPSDDTESPVDADGTRT